MKKLFSFFLLLLILGCSSGDDSTVVDGGETPIEKPVAVDDAATTSENESVVLEGLLANDDLVNSARITDIETSSSNGGTITDNRDNTYTYNPPSNYIGEDTFTYTICDNLDTPNCSTATVTITITGASPLAVDDEYTTPEDKFLKIINFLDNDEVVDNATVTSFDTEGTNATVVLENDGSITYTPETGFSGDDTFTYTLCDDDETPSCSTATITVHVTDTGSPIAQDDLIVYDSNAAEMTIENLLSNDDLTDDAVLTSVDASTSNGTVTLNEDGTITYTAAAGFSGEDTFTYTICDDDQEATCSTATVTVQVVQAVAFNIPAELQEYYSTAVFSNNADFNFEVISNLTINKHTTFLSYGQRHQYLYDADADLSNPANVILMYSGESRDRREYTSDSNSYIPQTFNTEHIYPQSRLTSDLAVSDLHHLRSSDADINSLRSNYPYIDASGEYQVINSNSWFPGDEWKGDVARMVLYLNIRYGETFDRVGSIELFLKWNVEDPVSAFEVQRNNVIEGAQGNRNPFIDNPYLATLIWGGTPAENKWN